MQQQRQIRAADVGSWESFCIQQAEEQSQPHAAPPHMAGTANSGDLAQALNLKLSSLGIRPGTGTKEAGEYLRRIHDLSNTPFLSQRRAKNEDQLNILITNLLTELPDQLAAKIAHVESDLRAGLTPEIDTGIQIKIGKFDYSNWRYFPGRVSFKVVTFPLYAAINAAFCQQKPNLASPVLESVQSPAIDRLRAECRRLGLNLNIRNVDDNDARISLDLEPLFTGKFEKREHTCF